MKSCLNAQKHNNGFTLIEVMLVIVLIGVMASVMQFNMSANTPEDQLKQSSARFAGIFDVAAEYAMLNNIEMGIKIEKQSYVFLGYDGERWSPIADQKIFEETTLPEMVEMTVELEDLPIDEPLMFDAKTLVPEDDDFKGEEKDKPPIPQIFILSGGDISPFSITFTLKEELVEFGEFPEDLGYRVTGIYSIPLTVEGPSLEEND